MESARHTENWLQRLIACALMMGVGKRELMESYYYDELSAVVEEWNALHNADEGTQEVDPLAFLGAGGEWVR